MNWQPIKTVDRSLNHCLIAGPHRGFTRAPFVGIGFWDGGCWRLIISVHGDPRSEPVDPTHWMPIPALPADINTVAQPMPDFSPAPLPLTAEEVIALARKREHDEEFDRRIKEAVHAA